MQVNLLAPLQVILRPKNQFALFFVSYFTAKLLHLGSHAGSLPILLYLLYFPTFLLPDVLLLVISKVLIYRHNGSQPSTIRRSIGAFLALFTAGCSAAQISFFVETGGEIQWMAASRVLGGSGGLGLLLSGLPALTVAFAILYSIAWVIAPKFHDAIEHVLDTIACSFQQSYRLTKKAPKATEDEELLIPLEEHAQPPSAQEQRATSCKASPSTPRAIAVSFTTLTLSIVVLVLQLVRPKSPPYAHMSGSLPVTLIEASLFQPIDSEFCLTHPIERVLFPWEQFAEFFGQPESLDWMPRSATCDRSNGPGPPPWAETPNCDAPNSCAPMPPPGPGDHGPPGPGDHGPPGPGHHGPPPGHHGPPPGHHGPPPPHGHHGPPPPFPDRPRSSMPDARHGFPHDGPPRHHGHTGAYEPLCDPLKLSNLDADILTPLATGLTNRKPKIKNVLLLTLESTRKDMFPLKKNSHAYNTILSSYASANASQELDSKLRNITSVAKFLSGESTGFQADDDKVPDGSWRHAFKDGFGSINVQGAVTQAAYTLKSLLSSHCGVEPLPVDFTEETQGWIYQSCLPQVLESLSTHIREEHKETRDDVEDHLTWPWESAMIQSVTDQFDSQDLLDEQMGFENVIAERVLSDPTSKHYPPKQPWVNYFGYPETESLDYLKDMFVDARQQQKRMFVSHLTSSPHHPFATPKDWAGHTEYLKKQRWRPEDPLDGYLNTIKYQDDWISDIFQMLHDVGALNETLVVMTGDHGLAFNSLDKSQSAVNNGHISNFAIPFLLVHPDLPRIQLKASTTPLSIIPTVLDLLLQTESLPKSASEKAEALLPKYQGNSLIRNLNYSVLTADGGIAKTFFQPFHFSAINPGGSLLAISDASTTFRLILPLCSSIPLRFTDITTDPTEADPTIAWTMDELVAIIKVKHGVKAKEWAKLARALGRWWFWNQHDKWGYWGNARSTGRGGAEVAGAGRVKKKHWWETRKV
ncbi:alkaline-phosphatase-like protein [Boeremia exigua]|uniref:alkaline-phosphatase-like protein n=1 Tax=Boeremia exigua TaxID=749465 RepID=UPI001E8E84FF|nr:alkaline-phosphatase-like protein [Boeremia exigua]KAH6614917.1 alkaline-phosphatase-like protein [Boeremia exigua]